MRRVTIIALCILLTAALVFSVSGATQASSMSAYATVSGNGSCQITLTVTLHLDQAVEDLTFPVPPEASSISLNGSRVRTTKTNSARLLDLSGFIGKVAGDFTFTVSYYLDNIISVTQTQQLELRLPLLSGFSYPVQQLEFSVTLPGEVDAKPAFSSGYHQTNIEKDLSYTVNGAVISGSSLTELKDHETLVLLLDVPEEMFPQASVELPAFDASSAAAVICAALALIYWLITLRCLPPRRATKSTPPDGYSAGQLGSILTMSGASLTMMVFSWAQFGYVLIQVDRHDRVLLHKRMEMGNERSSFERRCFQNLFGKRSMIDTSGSHYALQCQKAAKLKPNTQTFMRPSSGNPVVFRVLCAMTSLFCGIRLGSALGSSAALQWLLVFVLAVFGAISGWCIQRWAYSLFLFDKRQLKTALVLCAVWLLLGLLAGQFGIALWLCVSQLLAGLMAAYGGRRSEAGRQAMAQVLGLRRYLRTISRAELQRISENNPEYFHSLAPYALALNTDKAFAKHFGKMQLPGCPYLTTGMDGHMTAPEWSRLMRRAADSMEARLRQMPKERLFGIIQSFIK